MHGLIRLYSSGNDSRNRRLSVSTVAAAPPGPEERLQPGPTLLAQDAAGDLDPVLEALMRHGMAQGPAMALLLAGPALSLPSLLVIRSVLGNAKTAVFTVLVVVMATIVGLLYGAIG